MRGFNWLEYAEVAELVDAHDSGSCLGNQVEVQVLSSAPFQPVLPTIFSYSQ